MKKIILLLILLSLVNLVYSEETAGLTRIAINQETGECGYYHWVGSKSEELPIGWKTFHLDYENLEKKKGICIEGIGECKGKYQCKVNKIPEPYCWDKQESCENVGGWCEFYLLKTDIGECYFNHYNAETCCNNLGLTFISDVGKKKTDYSLLVALIVVIILLIIFFDLIKKKRKEKKKKKKIKKAKRTS